MFAESGNTLLDVCIFLLRLSNLTTNIRVFAFSEASLYSNSYWHYAIRFSQIMNNDLRQPCSITFLGVSWMLTSQYMIRKIYTCSDILKNEGFLKSCLRTKALWVIYKRYTINDWFNWDNLFHFHTRFHLVTRQIINLSQMYTEELDRVFAGAYSRKCCPI